MSGDATMERGIAIASEGSNFSVDPSADGSGYTAVPAENIFDIPNSTELLPTNYGTDGLLETEAETGPQGGELTFTVPHIGYNTAGNNGQAPDSTDWLDILLNAWWGSVITLNGADVSSIPDSTGLTLASDLLNIQHLVPVYEAGVPAAAPNHRTQWALVSVDQGAGDYDIVPAWESNPTGSSVMFATRCYRFVRAGGNSFAMVCRKGTRLYEFFGCQISGWQTVVGSGGRILHNITVRFDRQNENFSGKNAGLPAMIAAPTPTTLTALASPIWFNGTKYDAPNISINWGIETAELPSTGGAHGRAGYEIVRMVPSITFNPIGSDAVLNLKGTTGRCLIQFGGGVYNVTDDRLNTSAAHFEHMQCMDVSEEDSEGIVRNVITLESKRKVNFSGSTAAEQFQLARA